MSAALFDRSIIRLELQGKAASSFRVTVCHRSALLTSRGARSCRNPFHRALAEVERLRQQTNIILVDFHAEATSEKVALARMLDGRVSAVIGTHTHVQTADEQIFPGGTAFLCDAGFTGPHESVIGREIEPIIKRFMTNQPQKFEVAKSNVLLQGALVEIDERTGRPSKIVRISEPLTAAT